MDLSGSFLRTRVARRILAIFVLSAILPATTLALLGYRYMARDLEQSALVELRERNKLATMTLLERLATLTTTLELLAPHVEGGTSKIAAPPPAEDPRPGPRFRGLLLERSGKIKSVMGGPVSLPPLGPGQGEHLRHGGTALVVGRGTAGLEAYLVVTLDSVRDTRLWGLIDEQTTWGMDPSRSLAPQGTSLCLVSSTGEALQCEPRALAELARTRPQGNIQWTDGPVRYWADAGTVFLGREYAAPSWTLLLSIPEASIFSPLALLRRTFMLILALALVLVFALSHIQLRRTMEPLDELQAATRRLSSGEFDQPLMVRSGDEFEALATSFNGMASQLGAQFRRQDARREIDRAAIQAQDRYQLLGTLFERGEDLLPGRIIAVGLSDPDDPTRWLVTLTPGQAPREAVLDHDELNELRAQPGGFVLRAGELSRSYFGGPAIPVAASVIVLPLLGNGSLTGALILEPAAHHDTNLASLIRTARRDVDEVAVALAHTQLMQQLDGMSWGALLALARTIDAVSPWTAGHSERVTLGAIEIGRRLGLSEQDLDLLHRGGLLHDIGKVGIPFAILDKPSALTEEEYNHVKRHPVIGASILAPVTAFRSVIPLVLHHHETMDGLGYPSGLSGESIPFLVRIMTVADVFDALVSERPYRPAWSRELAVSYLERGAGVKFDPQAVAALAAAVGEGWWPQTGSATAPRPRGPDRVALSVGPERRDGRS